MHTKFVSFPFLNTPIVSLNIIYHKNYLLRSLNLNFIMNSNAIIFHTAHLIIKFLWFKWSHNRWFPMK